MDNDNIMYIFIRLQFLFLLLLKNSNNKGGRLTLNFAVSKKSFGRRSVAENYISVKVIFFVKKIVFYFC